MHCRRPSAPSGAIRRLTAVLAGGLLVAGGFSVLPATAAQGDVTATFTGGAGTVTVGDTLYARDRGALTLTVNTSGTTKCVDVKGGGLEGTQTSVAGKSTWTFTFVAGSGDGARSVTAAAATAFNGNLKCTSSAGSAQAGFTLDNTGPVVTGALSPAPNTAGWNNSDVNITWSATDSGSGVGTAPTPATDVQQQNTEGVTKTATATDRLGNVGTGSVTIKLDKSAPAITGTRVPAANSHGWNNSDVTVSFTCSDNGPSGIKSCSGPTTLSTSGANQSVTGNAVDNADNSASATVSGVNIDKVSPSLVGAPTSQPNSAGWYKDDVTIAWTAADALSGLAGAAPADSTITGEGQGLTATASVSDKAGNTTSATSAPARIDRTAPTTAITGASNGWTNGDVTVSLAPNDALSGVASTTYEVDGGAPQNGTSFTLSSEGDHVVTFYSTDRAGNVEQARTARVRIDKTAPSISHGFSLAGYEDGAWTNEDVTVSFTCTDQGGSGVASCTGDETKTAEGQNQKVLGTATDNAGNSATDTATVSIDKTNPTITGTVDREPNDVDWYNDDVTVSFTAGDALSGVASQTGSRTLGQGSDQSVTGTATDSAGNSASATVTGINIDKTDPVLTASYASGWHQGDVTVHWTCTDILSGVATEPEDEVVTGEGANLTSSATCTDMAGNTATEMVSDIQIDRTAPTTTVSVPEALDSGWYAGPVDVTFTGHDALSDVATTYYSVDGSDPQEYTGTFSFGTKGAHTITYWSVDNGGNVEDSSTNVLTLKIDGNPPTTTVINPISPASGWFVTSGIPVAFDANDEESGVAATYYRIDGGEERTYGEPFTEELGDGAHTITYWSVDIAGNTEEEKSTVVRVDTTPPTIKGSQSPTANNFGWNNTAVDVSFECSDVGSSVDGVAGCAGATTLTNEGAGQTVNGEAVDLAGNRTPTEYGPVNIDTTKPTLKGVPADSYAAGWYNDDVTVTWVGDDALSGINWATQPAESKVTGEGSNLGAGPVTIEDKAGNQSAPASVNGIKIDRTAPVVKGAATTNPNAAGWYKDAVTVDFKCADPKLADDTAGSGVATCPTSKVVSGDGVGQSVTSDPATDRAGNTSAGLTVGDINIDSTAPTTTADNQCTKTNGWCTGPTANVVLAATDQPGLSGVLEIHYRIDGGAEKVVAGATATVSVPLDGSGAGTVSYWAVDRAGNVEASNQASLKWDNIAPTVTHTLSPKANAFDWNNSDVTVHFEAKDDDAGSGVDATSVTADVVVTEETAGQVVNGSATDTAGNVGKDHVTVKLDRTAPTITGAITSGTKTASGWYGGPVTVTFTCTDALSGLATCSDPVVLAANGANTAAGAATDRAGNTTETTVDGIDIDQEKPTLTQADVNVNGATYTLGAVPGATCTATDSFSGLASCTVTVNGGNTNGVGTFTYVATATDKVGNTSTVTGTYKVIYRFDGFLQPINDTAHQVSTSTSIFKAGSTVPAKFQLKRADGVVVAAMAAPIWVLPVRGGSTSAPVDEAAYSLAGDGGGSYRWDSSAQQYIYNWKTDSKSAGNYWRIGVRLDDGQTYYVNIGLR